MGVFSTMVITREDAEEEILKHLRTAPDDSVKEALFELLGRHTGYNFTIVEEYEEDSYTHSYDVEGLYPYFDITFG